MTGKRQDGHRRRASVWVSLALVSVLLLNGMSMVWAAEVAHDAPYDAQSLYLTVGQTDYDLLKNITYDQERYNLDIADMGTFDIDVIGEYEIAYELTPLGEGAPSEPESSSVPSSSEEASSDVSSDTSTSSEENSSEVSGSESESTSSEESSEPESSESSASAEESFEETSSEEIFIVKTLAAYVQADEEMIRFTRKVFVEDAGAHFITFEAEPLRLTAGMADMNLLAGILAVDENGNPVQVQIVNAGGLPLAEPLPPESTPESSSSQTDSSSSSAESETESSSQAASSSEEESETESAVSSSEEESTPESEVLDTSNTADMEGSSLSENPFSVSLLSADLTLDESSSVDESSSSSSADESSSSSSDEEDETLPEPPVTPPANVDGEQLKPGTYTITYEAIHPETGEKFTATREVIVLAAVPGTELHDLSTSGTYEINVSVDPRPLKISGGIVAVHLSGVGDMQYNATTKTSIDVAAGSRLILVLEPGANVTCYGKDGDRQSAGGAGIHVPPTAALHIFGDGNLYTYGGAAGEDWYGGGGGGGAGIGGNGGNGTSNESSVAPRFFSGEASGPISIYTDHVYAWGGRGSFGINTDYKFSSGGFPGAGVGAGGGSGSYRGGASSGYSNYSKPNGRAFLEDGGGALPSNFNGIALHQNGTAVAAPEAAYGSADIIAQGVPDKDATGDMNSASYGMGIGPGRRPLMQSAIVIETSDYDILSANAPFQEKAQSNTFAMSQNPAPPTHFGVTGQGGEITFSWRTGVESGYALPDGWALAGFALRTYSSLNPKTTDLPSRTSFVPLSDLSETGGVYSYVYSSVTPSDTWATVSTVIEKDGVQLTSAATVTMLTNVFDKVAGTARVLDESSEYKIDVSVNPQPLKITGGIVTVRLSGVGHMQYDATTKTSIDVAAGSRLILVLEPGANVTCYGKDGDQLSAGGAGIHVPPTATLHIFGDGHLHTYGGAAGEDWYGGGGGGGAGIGGNGGNGTRNESDIAPRFFSGEASGPISIYTDHVYAWGGRGSLGINTDYGFSSGGFPGAGVGAGGGSGSYRGGASSGYSTYSKPNGQAFLEDGGGALPSNFNGIALHQNGTAVAAPKGNYGSAAVIALGVPGKDTAANPDYPYFGMGIGPGRRPLMQSATTTEQSDFETLATEKPYQETVVVNSLNSSFNPAPPVGLKSYSSKEGNASILWQAPTAVGYQYPDGWELAGFRVMAVSGSTVTPASIQSSVADVMLGDPALTLLADGITYSYRAPSAAMGQWVELSTILKNSTSGEMLYSAAAATDVGVIRVTTPSGAHSYHRLLKLALDRITADGQTGGYKITFMSDYTINAADLNALSGWSGKQATEVTFTSMLTTEDGNTVTDADGNALYAIVSMTTSSLSLPSTGSERYTFRQIRLKATTGVVYLCAVGHSLTMGDDVGTTGEWEVVGSRGATQTYNTSLTIQSGTYSMVFGGSAFTLNGSSTVTIEGGTIGALYGGVGGNTQTGAATIYINEDVTIPEVYSFDTMHIAPGKTLTVGTKMQSNKGKTNAAGVISFGEGSTMSLMTTAVTTNTAGQLVTVGSNAKLILKRGTDVSYVPLTLNGSVGTDVTGGKLRLEYPAGVVAQGNDKLLYFSGNKALADASPYENGFRGPFLFANPSTGYVYLGSQVSVQTDGGMPVFYGDLAAGMEAIGTGSADYTVLFRKEGYTISDRDKLALAANGQNARSITFASGFTTTAQDPLEAGETIGRAVWRMVNLSGDFTLNCPTYLDNLKLNFLTENPSVYANGFRLRIGTKTAPYMQTGTVDIVDHFPTIYGGSETAQVASTDVELGGGQFVSAYGGGKAGRVTGDTKLAISGTAELSGSVYGGGQTGDVAGTTHLTVSGGTVKSTQAHLVAGGQSGTAANATLAITGGTATNKLLIGGAEDGAVTGKVNIAITESAGPIPSAAMADIYGSIGSGAVGGEVSITLNNGKHYGVVSGGGLSSGTVSGTKTIAANSVDLKVATIKEFDHLYLGQTGTSTLSVTDQLYSQTGALHLCNASVLNLPATGEQRVGRLLAEPTGASHLHIGKGAGLATNPLLITGRNESSAVNRLTLGLVQEAAGEERLGDNLLVFDTDGDANSAQYISDTTTYDIVVSTDPAEPGVVEFGITSFPQVKSYVVRHRDSGGLTLPDTGGPVTKTIGFVLTNFKEDGLTYTGREVQSAYMDTAVEADIAWTTTGIVPAGGSAVALTKQLGWSESNPAWDGTTTLPIAPSTTTLPRFYYIHVRDTSGAHTTRVLDMDSPVNTTDPLVERDAGGNYTFKLTLVDPIPPAPADATLSYTASGLKQLAWSVGDTANQPGRAEALADSMVNSAALTVTNVDAGYTSHDWSFVIPGEKFGAIPSEKVVYLYAKDSRGNTRELALPMNENQIDVSVPARVGLIALKGSDVRLLAPECYVVNHNQTRPVKAEIVQVEIPTGNELSFVNKGAGFADNEINIRVSDAGGTLGNSFGEHSIVDISGTSPLLLGLMPPASGANHGAYFTFQALYAPSSIRETGSWSLFKLNYRFTLAQNILPFAPASPDAPMGPEPAAPPPPPEGSEDG